MAGSEYQMISCEVSHLLRRNVHPPPRSVGGQIRPPRPDTEDVPPRRVTPRFLTRCRVSADGVRGLLIRFNRSATAHRDHELTIVRWPNADIVGADAQETCPGATRTTTKRGLIWIASACGPLTGSARSSGTF